MSLREVAAIELEVEFVLDRYVLVLPENYPHGPRWIDTDEAIEKGDVMTVVCERVATGGRLWMGGETL